MKINISGLSEGVHRYVLAKSAGELGLDSNFTGDITANITLEKSIHQFLAIVNASVKGVFICDRCADEFIDIITTTYTAVYSCDHTEETEEDDDYHLLRNDENMIDFSSSIKEYILLSVPVKLLCGNNCEIPAQILTAEPLVDARWEKLKNLGKTEKN
ncbi:MAG: DUF177 domain-containing protein [Bacteriovoracaceae bacterium]|nr:DUF177 domain-containing protein [Bacteroidota bacterium]